MRTDIQQNPNPKPDVSQALPGEPEVAEDPELLKLDKKALMARAKALNVATRQGRGKWRTMKDVRRDVALKQDDKRKEGEKRELKRKLWRAKADAKRRGSDKPKFWGRNAEDKRTAARLCWVKLIPTIGNGRSCLPSRRENSPVSYTHLRAHET